MFNNSIPANPDAICKTSSVKKIYAKNLKEWHKIVCERVDYICQGCMNEFNYPAYFNENDVNQFVCGHHIETQGSHPGEDALDTDNGICVCKKCHGKLHDGNLIIKDENGEKRIVEN